MGRRTRNVLGLVTALGALGAAAAPASAATITPAGPLSALAGYQTAGPVHGISATITVPRPRCAGVLTTAASLTVRIGTPASLPSRIGVSVACINGHPVAYAFLSVFGQSVPTGPIRVGDAVQIVVHVNHSGLQEQMQDPRAGWFTALGVSGAPVPPAVAEVGVTRSAIHGVVLPLVNFGSAGFSRVHVDAMPIGSVATHRLTLSFGGIVQAAPSAVSGGTAFTVAWRHR